MGALIRSRTGHISAVTTTENHLKTILTTPVSQLTVLELTTLKVGLNKMKMQSEKISDVNKQIQEELESAEVTPEQLEQETNKVFDDEFKLRL